jgi:serine/threonine protein phosphatase PrpC
MFARKGAWTLVHASGLSDIGRVRKTNEDAFVADPDVRLFAVADGMGGHGAGEVASRLAIEAVSGFIRGSAGNADFTWPCDIDRTLSFDGNRLRTAIYLANRYIFRASESNDEYRGMGTTIVGLLVNGSRMSIGHVGDSRLYVFGEGQLEQVTHDDSWVATVLAQDPKIDPADIARHPMRHVLTSVLGAREHVDIHITERDLKGGEVMLLCSDGLHGVMDGDAVRDVLLRTPDVESAARRLVEAALERGSRDNVTALIVRYEADA